LKIKGKVCEKALSTSGVEKRSLVFENGVEKISFQKYFRFL